MSAEGWVKFKLDDLIMKKNQGVNTTTEKVKYSENGIPVIRAKNITNTGLDFRDITYVDIQTYERIREECKPQLHDILFI